MLIDIPPPQVSAMTSAFISLTGTRCSSFLADGYFGLLEYLLSVFQQNMSRRHHLVSCRPVPTWFRTADIAVNVTGCILKSPFSHFCNASGFFHQSCLPRKQAKETDYLVLVAVT